MHQHFRMFAAYNAWANGQIYDAVATLPELEFGRDVGAFFGSARGTLNHLLVADRIWMKRFTGTGTAPSSLDTILFADLTSLRAAREAEDARIASWIDGLSEEQLQGRVTYTTVTDLRTVSQRLAPALDHMFNHQTHHRGQIHTILTVLGRPSVVLDLVYFHRS